MGALRFPPSQTSLLGARSLTYIIALWQMEKAAVAKATPAEGGGEPLPQALEALRMCTPQVWKEILDIIR